MEYTQNIEEYKSKWFNFVKYKPHSGQKKLHFPPGGVYNADNNQTTTRLKCINNKTTENKYIKQVQNIVT